LNSNLCAHCVADLAVPKLVEQDSDDSVIEKICRVSDNFFVNRLIPLPKKLEPIIAHLEPFGCILWTIVKFVFSVVSSCFVCLFLMWLVQPSKTPQEQERDEREKERKKQQDKEWRAERDAKWAQEKAEQEAWEDARDAEYRRKEADRIAWEKERDAEFRKRKLEEDQARQKLNEEHERRKEEALSEARALAEKIACSDIDPDNDLRKMEEIGKELKDLDVPEATPDRPIEKIKKDAIDSRMDRANQEYKQAVLIVDDMWKRDTEDGSRDKQFDKAVDKIETNLEDAEKIRRRTKKES
jgi:hypothetical protein